MHPYILGRGLLAKSCLALLVFPAGTQIASAASVLETTVRTSVFNGSAGGGVFSGGASASGATHYDYENNLGTNSSIALSGASTVSFSEIGVFASADWTNLRAPETVPVNTTWFPTPSGVTSEGYSRLEFNIHNPGETGHIYSFETIMRMSGTMFFDNSTETPLFPWQGTARSRLGIRTYRSNGAEFINGSNEGDIFINSSFVPDGVLLSPSPVLVAFHDVFIAGGDSITVALNLRVTATVDTNTLLANTPPGDYGLEVDFGHTTTLSNFRFKLDGNYVDPSVLTLTTDAPVRFVGSNLEPTTSPVPEAASTVLLLGTALSLLLARKRASAGV